MVGRRFYGVPANFKFVLLKCVICVLSESMSVQAGFVTIILDSVETWTAVLKAALSKPMTRERFLFLA